MNITSQFLMKFMGKSWEVATKMTDDLSLHTNRLRRYSPLQVLILVQALEEVDKDSHLKRLTTITKSGKEYIQRVRGKLLANNLLTLDLDKNTVVVPSEIKDIIIKIAEEKLLHTSKQEVSDETYGSIDIKTIEKHEGTEYEGDIAEIFG